ncbi:MAG: CDP-glycerol glycerophosphotransferase family protein [Rhodospirillaceae bacterium]
MTAQALVGLLWRVFLAGPWRLLDLLLPKRGDWWAFPVHFIKVSHFAENPRALFEAVKDDPLLRKIVFARTADLLDEDLGGCNVVVVPLSSLRGLWLLARCKVVICDQSVSMNYSLRWGDRSYAVPPLRFAPRVVVNLWHGIPIKKLYGVWGDAMRRANLKSHMRREFPKYAGIVASSPIDSYAMCSIFSPLDYRRIWVTGVPKLDFLVRAENALPRPMQTQITRLRDVVGGRRVVSYLPTFRQVGNFQGVGYYEFTEADVAALRALLRRHDAVIGVRMHYFGRHHQRNGQPVPSLRDYIDGDRILDFSHDVVSEMAAVVRLSDVVVSDYSSAFVEAMLLHKPMVCFAYDRASYEHEQEGLLYDIDAVVPGPVVGDAAGLLEALDAALAGRGAVDAQHYERCRRFFLSHTDDGSGARVAACIGNVLQGRTCDA